MGKGLESPPTYRRLQVFEIASILQRAGAKPVGTSSWNKIEIVFATRTFIGRPVSSLGFFRAVQSYNPGP